MKRAAETAHQSYAILTRFGTFAQALVSVLRTLDYPDTLCQQSLENFQEFMRSTFEKENELRAEEIRTLWNLNRIVGEDQRDRDD